MNCLVNVPEISFMILFMTKEDSCVIALFLLLFVVVFLQCWGLKSRPSCWTRSLPLSHLPSPIDSFVDIHNGFTRCRPESKRTDGKELCLE